MDPYFGDLSQSEKLSEIKLPLYFMNAIQYVTLIFILCTWIPFFQAVASIDLPEIFRPETTDVYDAKNIPRVIYCLHALSLFLYKLGKAPQMLDLTGKATFTAEQISAMRSALDDYGLPMPQFRRIGGKTKFLQYY